MKKGLLIALPLFLILAGATYLTFRLLSAVEPSRLAAEPDTRNPVTVKSDTPYRLQPDRRFLLAVPEIPRLLRGIKGTGWLPDRTATTRVEFEGKVWRIHYGSELVGTLSEFPDFDEAIDLLTQWAAQKAKADNLHIRLGNEREAAVEAALSRLDVVNAAKQIDQEWKTNGPDALLLKEAVRSSVLFVALPDQLGSGDLVPARAVAWLAVTGALAPPASIRERCLLANLMGYRGAAYKLAEGLPANDAVRYFARGQANELADLASQPEAPREAGLFSLLAISRRYSIGEWASRLLTAEGRPKDITLLEAGTGLSLRSLDIDELVASAVLTCLRNELSAGSTARQPTRAANSGSLQALEEAIERTSAGLTGPLLDQTLAQTHFRTALYSALHVLGNHQLNIYSSVEASQEFCKSLTGTELSPLGKDFKQWYQALVDHKAGKPNTAELQTLLQADSPLGTPLRWMVYEIVAKSSLFGSPVLRGHAREFLRHVDSRLEDRVKSASVARDPLQAFTFREKLWASIAECGGPTSPSLQVPYFALVGDRGRLEATLQNSPMTPKEKAGLLEFLAGNDLDDDIIETQLAELCKASGMWDTLSHYVDFLLKRKRFRDAVDAIETWLRTSGETEHGLDMTVARTRLAEAYEGVGLFVDGLRQLDHPSVDQWQLGAMRRKALCWASWGAGTTHLNWPATRENGIRTG